MQKMHGWYERKHLAEPELIAYITFNSDKRW